jgi:solute carrier family 35 (UDP-galactose transporter), member B1
MILFWNSLDESFLSPNLMFSLHFSEQASSPSGSHEMTPLIVESTSSNNPTASVAHGASESTSSSPTHATKKQQSALHLLIGVTGIYGSFLYYGSLQEDVFRYASPETGERFQQAWFLQVLESLSNVLVGYLGIYFTGSGFLKKPSSSTSANASSKPQYHPIPHRPFAISGLAQVCAKACTSLALANGLSFPVATLAKSGKMAPVMLGSLCLGGAAYTMRDYLHVGMIIGGTALVSMGKHHSGPSDSLLGLAFILGSLFWDGITGGYQKRFQRDVVQQQQIPVKPYDFMLYTNLYMLLTALLVAAALGDLTSGSRFVMEHPTILGQLLQFCACSALGQSFIFYTLAHFDPLILSTVTTTRKLFSVLLSVLFKGNPLSGGGWLGIFLAGLGMLSEMHAKMHGSNTKATTFKK